MKTQISKFLFVGIAVASTSCNHYKDIPAPDSQLVNETPIVPSPYRSGATTARAGWASQTGFQFATTAVQRNIVSRASFSGPSFASRAGQHWGVDTDGVDGACMSDAIVDYHLWYHNQRTRANGVTLASIRNTMNGRFSKTAYSSTSKLDLVNRIVSVYNGKPYPAITIKPNAQEVINFLGFRAQCKEFTDVIALASGGRVRTYNSPGVLTTSNFRPGMALYDGSTHAMIIIDIQWSANGSPTRFRVSEANWGSGWSNPGGQRPWERTTNMREVAYSSRYKVVSYE